MRKKIEIKGKTPAMNPPVSNSDISGKKEMRSDSVQEEKKNDKMVLEAQKKMKEKEAEMPESANREEETKEESAEDKLKRLQAEFINFRARQERSAEEYRKYANAALLMSFLPLMDSIDKANHAAKTSNNIDALKEGLCLIHRQLKEILEKEGVTEIEALNKEFDPEFHQAVIVEEVTDKPDNIVLQELQKGYLYKNRVLRPSMVKVSKKVRTDIAKDS